MDSFAVDMDITHFILLLRVFSTDVKCFWGWEYPTRCQSAFWIELWNVSPFFFVTGILLEQGPTPFLHMLMWDFYNLGIRGPYLWL